jgi:DmsE family decaheme c-type cytochrome
MVALASLIAMGSFAWLRVAHADTPPPVDSAACLSCHESDAHAMAGTAHDTVGKSVVACTSCHTHVDPAHFDTPEDHPAPNPEHLRADSVVALCTTCHAHPHTLNLAERDPHQDADMSCLSCHRIHDNKHAGLLIEEQTKLCYSCHPSVRGDFARSSRHPVEDGVVKCSDCHMAVAQSKKQHTGSGPGETCVTCHAMFQGPFPFEHQAAVEYSTEDGGCLNCHEPHGSAHPSLLKRSYDAPDFALCMQCHSIPKHMNNSNHGTQWAGVPCNECHVDIHGSYESRKFLDPALASQGCFVVGCHQF